MAYKIPRGCQDIYGSASYQWQTLENTLRSICELYNYDEIRTPILNIPMYLNVKMIQVIWSIKKCIHSS